MTAMTPAFRKACIIGHPVAQSRSPMIHNHWLKALGIPGRYEARDLSPEAFPAFVADLNAQGYVGANVTVPHKEAAFAACSRLDAAARAIGAVNTLWLEGNVLCGGNSDAHGFIAHLDASAPGWQRSLGPADGDAAPACRALVLGAGGAARAVVWSLAERGVSVAIANRDAPRARSLARGFDTDGSRGLSGHAMADIGRLLPATDLLVNCTSLGMTAKPALEIDLSGLKPGAVVYDIVYVPLETPLLRQARERGHRVVDGLGMLLHQAGYGFGKWFGVEPVPDAALRAMVEADVAAVR
jgi:shikimate dehydrogenase